MRRVREGHRKGRKTQLKRSEKVQKIDVVEMDFPRGFLYRAQRTLRVVKGWSGGRVGYSQFTECASVCACTLDVSNYTLRQIIKINDLRLQATQSSIADPIFGSFSANDVICQNVHLWMQNVKRILWYSEYFVVVNSWLNAVRTGMRTVKYCRLINSSAWGMKEQRL